MKYSQIPGNLALFFVFWTKKMVQKFWKNTKFWNAKRHRSRWSVIDDNTTRVSLSSSSSLFDRAKIESIRDYEKGRTRSKNIAKEKRKEPRRDVRTDWSSFASLSSAESLDENGWIEFWNVWIHARRIKHYRELRAAWRGKSARANTNQATIVQSWSWRMS